MILNSRINKNETSNRIVSGLMCAKCKHWHTNGFVNSKTGEVQGECKFYEKFKKIIIVHHDYCRNFSPHLKK